MPKRYRDNLKREWAYAMRNVKQAMERVLTVQGEFAGVHDDYAELMDLILTMLDGTHTYMASVAKHAWLIDVEMMRKWLQASEKHLAPPAPIIEEGTE